MSAFVFDFVIGKTCVKATDDRLEFNDGSSLSFYHNQDCCEYVEVYDVCGDLGDLIGCPLLVAEEVESDTPEEYNPAHEPESMTWTFYKFATIAGSVTIRWLGTSNGYYSERVDWDYCENGKLKRSNNSWKMRKNV